MRTLRHGQLYRAVHDAWVGVVAARAGQIRKLTTVQPTHWIAALLGGQLSRTVHVVAHALPSGTPEILLAGIREVAGVRVVGNVQAAQHDVAAVVGARVAVVAVDLWSSRAHRAHALLSGQRGACWAVSYRRTLHTGVVEDAGRALRLGNQRALASGGVAAAVRTGRAVVADDRNAHADAGHALLKASARTFG